jgi:hypothetical protein
MPHLSVARDFRDWLSEFCELAEAILRDNPEWLERLGIRHPSEA